jgi:4-amino-4-deoxy-L-arabinose transferase-like glycosyltransferase
MENKLKLTWGMVPLLTGVILAAVIWKVILLKVGAFPFNSDEAIVALMARHILRGEIPIFFYGQAYMGSLDAFLVAAGFQVLGESVQAVRYVQILIYCGILLTTFWLAFLVFRSLRAALFSIVLLMIPTVNMTLYTTVSLGGYGEALLIGNLILCIGYLSVNGEQNRKSYPLRVVYLVGWGILAGFGLWANGLTMVYSVPVGVYLISVIWRFEKSPKRGLLLGTMILGSFVGALPWLIYAIQNSHIKLLQELFGSAVAVEGGTYLSRVFMHLVNFLLLGIPVTLGFRPPWEVRWLVLPLIPFVAFFWFLVIKFSIQDEIKQEKEKNRFRVVLGGVAICLILMFILTQFGVDPSGRYFLPISIILALFGGDFIDKGIQKNIWKWGTLILIVVFQLIGTFQCIQKNPPGITTQFDSTTVIDHRYDDDLIQFLKENGEIRGYTNYWVSYPLAFLSGEELIFTPRLPYHLDLRYTSRDDRYLPYDILVKQSEKTALITTKNPALENRIREILVGKNVNWKEKTIGDYQVFYALSTPLRESDLNFSIQP